MNTLRSEVNKVIAKSFVYSFTRAFVVWVRLSDGIRAVSRREQVAEPIPTSAYNV